MRVRRETVVFSVTPISRAPTHSGMITYSGASAEPNCATGNTAVRLSVTGAAMVALLDFVQVGTVQRVVEFGGELAELGAGCGEFGRRFVKRFLHAGEGLLRLCGGFVHIAYGGLQCGFAAGQRAGGVADRLRDGVQLRFDGCVEIGGDAVYGLLRLGCQGFDLLVVAACRVFFRGYVAGGFVQACRQLVLRGDRRVQLAEQCVECRFVGAGNLRFQCGQGVADGLVLLRLFADVPGLCGEQLCGVGHLLA